MPVQEDATPLASFETKWIPSHPELGLALSFVAESSRQTQVAFACLAFELEYAAFGIRETQPAAIKLQWWAEEFMRAGGGETRHPLTRALAAHPAFSAIPLTHWHALVAGALAQRDPEPATDRAALLRSHALLYGPLATIEAQLFAPADVAALTQLRALSRALRETAALADGQRDDRLALPLDVLARHRLVRGDLSRSSPQQAAALREWLQALEQEYAALAAATARIGLPGQTTWHADRWRVRRAARAADPLAQLNADLGRLPFGAAWAAWRAARRLPG